MKNFLRKIINRVVGAYFDRHTKASIAQIPSVNKGVQILLSLKYKELANRKQSLPEFADVEFRAFSQNGEDGILLYIFSLIGTTNKKTVEIAAGNGVECNTANLIIHHGWTGLLVDGEEKNITTARDFYENSKDTFIFPPKIEKAWVTAENVNQLVSKHGFSGEIDLLSIDLDGMDYWIWKTLDEINPRVVVLEYNEKFGFESVTVPYDSGFNREGKDRRYHGASLPAFVKLAKEKGYRLVGCNRQKFNAFFVKEDIAPDILPEVSFEFCLRGKNSEDYTLLSSLKQYPFQQV